MLGCIVLFANVKINDVKFVFKSNEEAELTKTVEEKVNEVTVGLCIYRVVTTFRHA